MINLGSTVMPLKWEYLSRPRPKLRVTLAYIRKDDTIRYWCQDDLYPASGGFGKSYSEDEIVPIP